MAECRKCKRTLESDWIVCPYCGTPIMIKKVAHKSRPNGSGTAIKRGSTWTARVIVDWRSVPCEDGTTKLRPVSKTKGGFKTKTAALEYCQQLKKSPNKLESNLTFKQVYDRWVPYYEPRIASITMATYKAAFKHFSSVYYYKITTMTVDDLQQCIDSCDKGRSTKDNMRSVCSLVFKYACQNNLVDKNLASFLYSGKEKKGTRSPITFEELKLIKDAVGKEPYADYVYCLCYTGFRPNEMLSLKKDAFHVVEHEGRVYNILIGGCKTPAGIDRTVTISPKILPIIEYLLKSDSEYLFPKEDGSMMDDEYFRENCFYPLMDKLGIKGKVPYSCRHTFANLLKQVYGSDTDKASLIGHADASMTKYYQSADYASMAAITDAL